LIVGTTDPGNLINSSQTLISTNPKPRNRRPALQKPASLSEVHFAISVTEVTPFCIIQSRRKRKVFTHAGLNLWAGTMEPGDHLIRSLCCCGDWFDAAWPGATP